MTLHANHPVARPQARLAGRQSQPTADLKALPPDTAEALVVAAIEISQRICRRTAIPSTRIFGTLDLLQL